MKNTYTFGAGTVSIFPYDENGRPAEKPAHVCRVSGMTMTLRNGKSVTKNHPWHKRDMAKFKAGLPSTTLAEIGLSERVLALLVADGVEHVWQACALRQKGLLRVPNLGRKALAEVTEKLSAIGVSLNP